VNRQALDWTPLAESDPLPGDPEAILDEAIRLRRLGFDIRDQIASLRRIAANPDLVGKSVDALRASAGEIVVGLEKALGRHEQTADILSAWHGQLIRLQGATLKPLEEAHEAQRIRARAETDYGSAIPIGMAGPGPGAMLDYQTAVERADALLVQAKRALYQILEEHRRLDREFAHLIDEATDDDAEDGRWDNFKDWVDRNKKWIHGLTEALGIIGATAALAALVIAGVGLALPAVTALAVGTAVASLVGHTTLASAGHASKFDIGLDVFALATFGAGRVVTSALRTKQAATRVAAASAARRTATDAALSASQTLRDDAARVLADSGSTAWARIHARVSEAHAVRFASRAGDNAAKGVTNSPLPESTWVQRVRSGNPYDPVNIRDIRAMQARFPGDSGVREAARGADFLAYAGIGAFGSAAVAEGADRVYDDKEKWDPYMNLKGRFQREVGSTW
jgi:hypothetical protein